MDYFDKHKETDITTNEYQSNFKAGKDEKAITYGLKSIYFDFQKCIFEINGKSVVSCSDIEISCHNGEWSVSITEKGIFNGYGVVKPKIKTLP